jgi:hypothetical protein
MNILPETHDLTSILRFVSNPISCIKAQTFPDLEVESLVTHCIGCPGFLDTALKLLELMSNYRHQVLQAMGPSKVDSFFRELHKGHNEKSIFTIFGVSMDDIEVTATGTITANRPHIPLFTAIKFGKSLLPPPPPPNGEDDDEAGPPILSIELAVNSFLAQQRFLKKSVCTIESTQPRAFPGLFYRQCFCNLFEEHTLGGWKIPDCEACRIAQCASLSKHTKATSFQSTNLQVLMDTWKSAAVYEAYFKLFPRTFALADGAVGYTIRTALEFTVTDWRSCGRRVDR